MKFVKNWKPQHLCRIRIKLIYCVVNITKVNQQFWVTLVLWLGLKVVNSILFSEL